MHTILLTLLIYGGMPGTPSVTLKIERQKKDYILEVRRSLSAPKIKAIDDRGQRTLGTQEAEAFLDQFAKIISGKYEDGKPTSIIIDGVAEDWELTTGATPQKRTFLPPFPKPVEDIQKTIRQLIDSVNLTPQK